MVPARPREERQAAAEFVLTARSAPTLAAFAIVLLAGGLLVRLPVLYLPVDGDAALLAGRAAGEVDGAVVAHRGPLMPLLLRVPIALGVSPTTALRLLDVLCGALIAPLAFGLGLRAGLDARRAGAAAGLLVVHPMLLTFAGGPVGGTSALLAALLLVALRLLPSERARVRRTGAVVAALAPLVDPYGLAWWPFFAYEAVRGERGPRARGVLAGVFLAGLVLAPVPLWLDGTSHAGRLAAAGLAAGVATLVVLLPGVPAGVRALAGAGACSVRDSWAAPCSRQR